MTERSVVHATFVINRVYDASPARVFRAFSNPEARDRWFVKSEGWPVAEYSYDSGSAARSVAASAPTARWRSSTRRPTGTSSPTSG
jgi:uncharacterized protein YndB with AHSA1/START domain